MNEEKDRAILVGLQLNNGSSFEHNLEELESLCQACDIAPVFTITQSLDAPHQALYIAGTQLKPRDRTSHLGSHSTHP